MSDFPVVDAHVHVWDPARWRYPWIEDIPTLLRPFSVDDYREATDSINVEALVFVQCDCEVSRSLDEARWIADLAQTETRFRAIVPHVALEHGEACRPQLEELESIDLVRGVRRLIQSEPDPGFCLRPGFLQGLHLLAELDLSFDICVSHVQLASVVDMVGQCPEVSFILDHIGKPDIRQAVMHPWVSDVERLSKFPNVVCKISGLVTEADHDDWKKEDLKPYLDHVIECFGFDRVLYGGDWPVVTLAGTHARWWEALEWALEGCSDDERSKLFRENARRDYRIQ
jgi:L-fuconolactonase